LQRLSVRLRIGRLLSRRVCLLARGLCLCCRIGGALLRSERIRAVRIGLRLRASCILLRQRRFALRACRFTRSRFELQPVALAVRRCNRRLRCLEARGLCRDRRLRPCEIGEVMDLADIVVIRPRRVGAPHRIDRLVELDRRKRDDLRIVLRGEYCRTRILDFRVVRRHDGACAERNGGQRDTNGFPWFHDESS
jgi:hypothetical protein